MQPINYIVVCGIRKRGKVYGKFQGVVMENCRENKMHRKIRDKDMMKRITMLKKKQKTLVIPILRDGRIQRRIMVGKHERR